MTYLFVAADSLKKFGQLITAIEDERDRMVSLHEWELNQAEQSWA